MSQLSSHALKALATARRLGRRDFLKYSVTAGLVGALGSSIGVRAATAVVPDDFKSMGELDHAVFKRLMEVTLPTQGTLLLPTAQVPVLQTLDAALLGTMEPHNLQGLKEGIGYFNQGPVTQLGKPFVELDDASAAKFCDQWGNASDIPQRALAVGLKKLVALAYWANPPTWAPLGYDGPVSNAWELKPRGNSPLPKL